MLGLFSVYPTITDSGHEFLLYQVVNFKKWITFAGLKRLLRKTEN